MEAVVEYEPQTVVWEKQIRIRLLWGKYRLNKTQI